MLVSAPPCIWHGESREVGVVFRVSLGGGSVSVVLSEARSVSSSCSSVCASEGGVDDVSVVLSEARSETSNEYIPASF